MDERTGIDGRDTHLSFFNMIRLYASDPAYQEIADIAESIARLVNAHCWFNIAGAPELERRMPDIERAVALHDLVELFEELTH